MQSRENGRVQARYGSYNLACLAQTSNGTRLMFGEYRNVFLTEKDYKRLKADFSGLDDLIEQLSAYIQSTGRKYADHAATLRIWAKRQKTEQKSTPGIPDYTFKEGESL